MPEKVDPSTTDSVYAKPTMVSAGNDTFYIVVNNEGLKNLTQTGLLSSKQREKILEQFGETEVKDSGVKDHPDYRLFIIEAKKNGNDTVPARAYSGQYLSAYNSGEGDISGLPPKDYSPSIILHETLNLTSTTLPKQQLNRGETIELDSAHPSGNLTKESAEKLRKSMEARKDELAATMDPNMAQALAMAKNAHYAPTTPEGYKEPATNAAAKTSPKISLA